MRVLAALLTLFAVVAARDAHAQGTGEWVRADGSAVYIPCPSAREYGARTRIPASCRVAHPGILYTLDRDARAEADAGHVVELSAEARELREAAANDRAILERLQRDLAALADEHHTLADQLQAANLATVDAERRAQAADARSREFGWGDAAIGAAAGAVVAGVAVFALLATP